MCRGLIMINAIVNILGVSKNSYWNYKKQERPIIAFLEKYFSKDDLEEFLNYGRVSKLEYLNSMRENEINFLFKFINLLEELHSLYTLDDFSKIVGENESADEYSDYKKKCPNTIDYLCFAIIKNEHNILNIFDMLIRHYDEYKSKINNQMTSYYLDDIYNICKKQSLDKELINFVAINNSLYYFKKMLDFQEMIQSNESSLEDMGLPIPLQFSNYQINLAMEFSIRYNLYLKKSNKSFEEIYDKYKIPEFGTSKIDYDKFKKDIENL